MPKRQVIDECFNKHGEAFLDFLIEARLAVTNGRIPGRNDFTSVSTRGKSLVDYIAVPHENFSQCVTCDVHPINEIIERCGFYSLISERSKQSDHSPIKLTYLINSVNDAYCTDNQNADQDSIKKRYNYNTISPDFLKSESWIAILDSLICRLDNVNPMQSQVDSLYDDMLSYIFAEMDEYIDYKYVSNKSRKRLKFQKPFWNDHLTSTWKDMTTAEKLFRKSKHTPRSTFLRSVFLEKQKCFDKLLRQYERKYNRQKAIEIEDVNTSNPTEFWKHINSLGPKKSNKIPMEVYTPCGSNKTSDKNIVLDTWRHDFEGLYNIPDSEHENFDVDFYENILSRITDIKQFELNNTDANVIDYNQPFSMDEMNKICTRIKLGKAVGPDMIPNEVLKHVGLRELMLKFMNSCFINNVIPSVWRKAVIAPIPKSATKDPCVPLNYRGISLLSCMYKMFSSLLNLRITSHCEESGYIVDEQNGFRSGRSCQDHIYALSTVIRNRKSCGQSTYCAYIDFKKAFDWVNRDLLLYKVATSFDIHGRLFNNLASVYSISNSQLRLNGLLSESFNVTSGVRQGDIMSPVLFSMFLNDLATGIKDLNCGVQISDNNLSILLYADDIVFIAPSESALQTMLTFVSEWCRKWRMAVNMDKTKVIHFRKKSIAQTAYDFQLGNVPVEKVCTYKYLGVLFDEFLNFEQNAVILADAAGRALGAIRTKLKYLKECGFKSFNTLFKCGVLSISDYAAGVWGTKRFNKTEQVMYRGARYFLGVHRFASIDALLGDLGWVPAQTRHKELILKLWNRLCQMPLDRITRQVFDWDLLYSTSRGSWSFIAKSIFNEIGHPEIFDNVIPCSIDDANVVFSIQDQSDWDLSRYKSDKLRYYNLYKNEKCIEEYLTLNISKYHRSLFAQFRCGILPLEIEVGRYRNIDLCDRTCLVCNNAVEDEIHFLCQCPLYIEPRTRLFQIANESHSDFHHMDVFDQFVYLMSNQQRHVVKFLSKAIPLRTDRLFNRAS